MCNLSSPLLHEILMSARSLLGTAPGRPGKDVDMAKTQLSLPACVHRPHKV